ncbi:MAG: HAMP domain-containing histidine kinase [Microbacteriaceae bacterium]|nr:HAMP domain-containing histidine kinase [Microbacteriaceae bacterium]
MTGRSRAPWSLQRRLVIGIMLLLALVSIVVGAVSTAALGRALTVRVDEQLRSAADILLGPSGPGRGEYTPSPRDALRPGAIVLVESRGSVVVAGYVADDGTAAPLTTAQRDMLLDVEGGRTASSVDLGELGEYRVLAETTPAGERLVVGLPLAESRATTLQLLSIIALVTAVALAATAVIGSAVVRIALRPLGRVADTAARVSRLPLAKGEVDLVERVPDADTDTRTEVGRLGAAINRMLDHVASALLTRQESEGKVRRFVADASHELRTPLTSIRGYAELTRRGGHELPPDVARSMERIESEAIRMTSLVEDLLLLARLDEGRDLETRPVDLSGILLDAVSDAHAAALDHAFALDLPDVPVIVSGDDSRLRQVVANLLANARVHTPAGTAITVGLEARDSAILTVADNGPGIPAERQASLFERFTRGDESRSRAAGSTGLGLAIVRGVVEGHGGTVSLDSVPGRTVFTVELPLASQPASAGTRPDGAE